jgi:4-alpha-glucanotransferase
MPKYKGSFIAKQIEDDIGRYERDKARALKLKALRDAYEERKRGESNGERTEFDTSNQENTKRTEGN